MMSIYNLILHCTIISTDAPSLDIWTDATYMMGHSAMYNIKGSYMSTGDTDGTIETMNIKHRFKAWSLSPAMFTSF